MTETGEDPAEAFAQEISRTRGLQKKRAESQDKAAKTRSLRMANGWDRLLSGLMEGRQI